MNWLRLDHKNGSRCRLPHKVRFFSRSELESQPKLEVPHEGIGGQAADAAGSTAVNAAVGLAVVRMVEDVKRLSTELATHSFGDGEVLEYGQIRIEEAGSVERVAPAAELGDTRP